MSSRADHTEPGDLPNLPPAPPPPAPDVIPVLDPRPLGQPDRPAPVREPGRDPPAVAEELGLLRNRG